MPQHIRTIFDILEGVLRGYSSTSGPPAPGRNQVTGRNSLGTTPGDLLRFPPGLA